MRGMRQLLAVMLLVATSFNVDAVRTSPVAAALPDWRPYIDAGETVALALTTIGYQTVDRDVQHILDNATGTFYDSFQSRSAAFTQVVLDAKSTSTATITESRLDSADAAARLAAADHGAEGGRGVQSVQRGVPTVIAGR